MNPSNSEEYLNYLDHRVCKAYPHRFGTQHWNHQFWEITEPQSGGVPKDFRNSNTETNQDLPCQ